MTQMVTDGSLDSADQPASGPGQPPRDRRADVKAHDRPGLGGATGTESRQPNRSIPARRLGMMAVFSAIFLTWRACRSVPRSGNCGGTGDRRH
jgi:hypothetical protein